MSSEISRERADLIKRQFDKYQAWYGEQGIGRRDFLRLIAKGTAAATVFPALLATSAVTPTEVAEASQPDPAPAPALGRPASRGGSILIATLGEAQTINPLLTNETEGQWRCKMMYDEFVELDPATLQPRARLARSWQISEDKVYTFTLQDNIKFSDGSALTADDVAFTLHAMLKKDTASPYVPRFTPIKGAKEYNDGTADKISGVEVVDDKTIRLTLNEPFAPFLSNLRWLRPLPKKLLDGKNYRDDGFFQSPVGAGPFKFKSWTTGGDFIAERNPYYWQADKPDLDGFTHRVIADSQTLIVALQTGQVEGSDYALPTQSGQLKSNGNLVVLVTPPGKDVNGWSFSAKNNPALADARVRKAIAMALDVEQFSSDFLLGLGKPAVNPIPPSSWAFNQKLKPLPYDVDAAKKLLQDAGVSNLKVRVTTNAGNKLREDWVTFTQQGLQDIGIEVQPDVKEWAQVVKEGTDGTFEMICPTFAAGWPDPDELYLPLRTGSSRNVYGYSNPDMDKLLDQGRTTTDIEKRKVIYDRIQEILQEDVPVFYAWDRPFIYVTTNSFEGYENNLISLFQQLDEWKRK